MKSAFTEIHLAIEGNMNRCICFVHHCTFTYVYAFINFSCLKDLRAVRVLFICRPSAHIICFVLQRFYQNFFYLLCFPFMSKLNVLLHTMCVCRCVRVFIVNQQEIYFLNLLHAARHKQRISAKSSAEQAFFNNGIKIKHKKKQKEEEEEEECDEALSGTAV